jgi:hypothetical protein
MQEVKREDLLLNLWVLGVNPAKYLYERLGFKVLEENVERIFMQYKP